MSELGTNQTIIYSIEEVVDAISEGLPPEQRQANSDFVHKTHASLKEGGSWGAPNMGRIFTRRGDGFEVWVMRHVP